MRDGAVIVLVLLIIGGALLLRSGNVNIPQNINTGGSVRCPDDGTVNLDTKVKNPSRLNSTADYLGETLYFRLASSGEEVSSASQNADGTFKSTSTSTLCGESYILYTKNDGGIVYCSKSTGPLSLDNSQFVMECPRSSELEFKAFDSSNDNITSGWVQDSSSNSATAVGSSETHTLMYQVRAKTSGAQFGSSEAHPVLCIDANPSKYSKTNGVQVNCAGHTFMGSDNLPDICSVNGYETWYDVTPIGSDEGMRECDVTIRSDLGDPGASDDVKFAYFDKHAYTDLQGIGIGTSDTSNSGVGETDRYWTFDVS